MKHGEELVMNGGPKISLEKSVSKRQGDLELAGVNLPSPGRKEANKMARASKRKRVREGHDDVEERNFNKMVQKYREKIGNLVYEFHFIVFCIAICIIYWQVI